VQSIPIMIKGGTVMRYWAEIRTATEK